MLRIFTCLLLVAVISASCFKNNQDASCPYPNISINAPLSEQQIIEDYLDSNNLEATLHNSGFYYSIINPGTGTDTISLCSQILINYRGNVMDSTKAFDQQLNAYFVLGSLIEGWKKGIPLIKRGGEIKLYIPPSLGYGNNEVKNDSGVVIIPAKSVLIFNVKLLDHN